jgi:hypothetical protein
MISQLKSGTYTLFETKHHIKMLKLDGSTFAWISPPHIGSILVASRLKHKVDSVMSCGHFIVYDVVDEPELK